MIKYYCDICGKEITEGRVRAELRCNVIPSSSRTVEMYLHKQCAIDFIGKDRIAEMQKEADERKKAIEARKAERMKKEGERNE